MGNWELRMYPAGYTREMTTDNLPSLYLVNLSTSNSDCQVFYEVSILGKNKTKISVMKTENGAIVCFTGSVYGAPIAKDTLEGFIVNDTLQVVCDIVLCGSETKTSVELVDVSRSSLKKLTFEQMSDKFEEGIADNKKTSDVTISCDDGKEFFCHQNVLSARSPVFKEMFEANMKEKETGIVEIRDFNSVTVKKIVFYLYTGIVPDGDGEESLKELLMISNKYQILQLRKWLTDKLISMLSDENCIEYLGLGEIIDVKELKEAAFDFLTRKNQNLKKRLEKLPIFTKQEVLDRIFYE